MVKKISIAVLIVTLQLHGSVNQAGQPVRSFGVNGTATLTLAQGDVDLSSVVVDPQGRIVVVGRVFGAGALIARFTPSGQLDTSFNNLGYRIFTSNDVNDVATSVGLLGSIIYVGCYNQPSSGPKENMFITSFTDSGAFNTQWGVNGIYSFNIASATSKVIIRLLVQPDGKIIVAGSLDFPNSFVARTNSAGTALDTTFNAGGTPGYILFGGNYQPSGLMFLSNQRIAIVGSTSSDTIMYVFTSAGVADTTFNGTGASEVLTGFRGTSFIQQSNGAFVIMGGSSGGGFPDLLTMRLTSNGILDTSYGVNGTAFVWSGATSYATLAISIYDIFFIGSSSLVGLGNYVICSNGNGSLNSSFGNNAFAPAPGRVVGLSNAPDGTLVAVSYNNGNGYVQKLTQYDIAEVGFSGDGLTVASNGEVQIEPIFKIPVVNEQVLPEYVIAGFNGF